MKRYGKVVIEGTKRAGHVWAIQVFFLSISLSLVFGFLTHTVLSSMGAIIAIISILIFILLGVVFDMIGIAVASADEGQFEIWNSQNIKGARAGLKLCRNCEKVCSFCADVVGDICSTLCGAGGACIVVSLTSHLTNSALIILISVSVSALIAGITIFCKALMKERALKHSNKIILRLGIILEKTIYYKKNDKNSEK